MNKTNRDIYDNGPEFKKLPSQIEMMEQFTVDNSAVAKNIPTKDINCPIRTHTVCDCSIKRKTSSW
jgi:hypothetical protein